MKRVFTIIAIAAVIFTSCEYEDPYADFVVDYQYVIPGEFVSFRNYSTDASRYEWDFGDGTISNEVNPSHYYSREGNYRVTLSAYNGGSVDYAYMDIEVYYTTLEIEVREYYSEALIPEANVDIYPTYSDYDNFINLIASGTSDDYGIVVFTQMDAISYYIDVYNGSFNNFTLASEDINIIKTLPLDHAKYNVFTAYVDYANSSTKSTIKNMRVVEVKKTTKNRTLEEKKKSLQN